MQASALANYDDLRALPEGALGEIVAGELQLSPSPRSRHSRTQRALGSFIVRPFDDDDRRALGRDGQLG